MPPKAKGWSVALEGKAVVVCVWGVGGAASCVALGRALSLLGCEFCEFFGV